MRNTVRHTTISPHAGSSIAIRRARLPKNGGYRFAGDPQRTALDQAIFWIPVADPGAILLQNISFATSDSAAAEQFMRLHELDRIDAEHLRIGVAGERFEVMRISADSSGILIAVVVLDNDMLERLHALSRFCAMLTRRPALPDNRLTPQRRRRTRQMLLASDARAAGATYREIAIAIYGHARVASEPWKTSSLRDATIGFVEGGLAMIAGGYLQLLRYRRRRSVHQAP